MFVSAPAADRNLRPRQANRTGPNLYESASPPLQCLFVTILAILAGCQPQQPFYLKNVDNDLEYWKGQATEIEIPTLRRRLPDTAAPTGLLAGESRPQELWELTLEEAMQMRRRTTR